MTPKTATARAPPGGARRSHVVVVGAGFGGLAAARELSRHEDLEVTLVDRQNHHLFQPLLYQVATAGLSPADIAAPVRAIVKGQPRTRVLLDLVTGVDATTKRLSLASGASLDYDALVLATGATHSYFGQDQWAEHAPGIKTIDDALRVRRTILLALERAETSPAPGVAPAAKQQGAYVARVIAARRRGAAPPPPFRYRNYGNLATIGRKRAVADLGWIRFHGMPAWMLWSTAHIYFLVGFRNRIVVGANWFWNYLTFDRGARLITGL